MSTLKIWVGPMFSGKSNELIANIAPHRYASPGEVGLFQPTANTRDGGITSRLGQNLEAKKINSLSEILNFPYTAVGIDEIHLFQGDQRPALLKLISRNVSIFMAGLDKDYRGALFPIISQLLELPNVTLIHKMAVCNRCKSLDACYTQIYRNGEPILEGLESAKVEDPLLQYEAACSSCFKSTYLPLGGA